ncbi:interleukin-8-like isoform X2 [Neoarius graeffei]|uniref:interleukin-8-like isoform X2 n=1 Tax=Neoarius graeffei TaxID=443677 RepID=UPI00298D2A58|nr:interleukin-8-like isoform X2 [Neoarius graeffei]
MGVPNKVAAKVLQLQLRCQCTSIKVEQEISNDRIVKMEVFQPGPHCNEKEVIALVKFRKEVKLCLNPKDKWVQKALKRRNLAL